MKTYALQQGKIIETSTEVKEHDPAQIIADLEAQKSNIIAGRDAYLLDINTRIADIDTTIQEINALL